MILLGRLINNLTWFYRKARNIYLQDRYTKEFNVGKDVIFYGISSIRGAITTGDNVHFGNNAYIAAGGGLDIGSNVHLSRNLVLYSQSHNWRGKRLPFDDTTIYNKIIIEDNVWVGYGVTILPGSHLREGCIISAGSTVSGIVPARAIYVHNRITWARDLKRYNELKLAKQFGEKNGKEYKKLH